MACAALATNDGLLLPDYINALASYEGDPHVRSSTLIQIAEKQPFASHLVVGVLSGLALNNLPNAKEFARKLIASPLDREKDLIVARAHTVLLELPPIDVRDVPVIAAGLVHPFDQVR
jgi:hypothetical protein